MRLLLTLQHRPGAVLPINYQWLIASWIYRTLEKADPVFSNWLHEQGYGHNGRQYRLFTFGSLDPQRYDIDREARAFVLAEPPTRLLLSFYIDEAMQRFVMGLFRDQSFSLSSGSRFKADFSVIGLEMLAKPVFRPRMRFRLISPLCISRENEEREHADYLHPADEGYGEGLLRNLLHKQQAVLHKTAGPEGPGDEIDFPWEFRVLTEPKSKLLSIKDIRVRGYLFDFELAAPPELLEVGYFGGFGEKNSGLGMGMTIIMENEKRQPEELP